MGNYLNGEFYRLWTSKRRRYFFIGALVLMFFSCVILKGQLDPDYKGLEFQSFLWNLLAFQLFWEVYRVDIKDQTLENMLAVGISKNRLVVGKFIVASSYLLLYVCSFILIFSVLALVTLDIDYLPIVQTIFIRYCNILVIFATGGIGVFLTKGSLLSIGWFILLLGQNTSVSLELVANTSFDSLQPLYKALSKNTFVGMFAALKYEQIFEVWRLLMVTCLGIFFGLAVSRLCFREARVGKHLS